VAPVIAVAFSWVILFDPFSGSVNALLIQMGVTDSINFFGERPLALIMVTVFEIWRYFPLSFLFILARMQSIDPTCTRRRMWTGPRRSRSSAISACRC
jgi:multiple sugar transport system permease protein